MPAPSVVAERATVLLSGIGHRGGVQAAAPPRGDLPLMDPVREAAADQNVKCIVKTMPLLLSRKRGRRS